VNIVILDSTAVPGVKHGPGSPAFFSRYVIEHLSRAGHEVKIMNGFEATVCSAADLVWSEWCNEEAYRAAESGTCKRLVIRMRGYDAWGPLHQLAWHNVDALVYESVFLRRLAEEKLPELKNFNWFILPSGIDVANIPFRERTHGPVVAMAARGVADKGYQLAWEWARSRPEIQLHAALALPEPRLRRYLEATKPDNVTMYEQVETVKWLDEINANYLLSSSNWESLGYTIAEAMALGIMPLIHNTPGATLNWGESGAPFWQSLDWLNDFLDSTWSYHSRDFRAFVESHLDAAKQSKKFAGLVLSLPERDNRATVEKLRRGTYDHTNAIFTAVRKAIERPTDMQPIDEAVTDFRSRLEPHSIASSERYGIALATAVAHFNHEHLVDAEMWACRAMLDFCRPDAMCLMGEAADARGDIETAFQWYKAACAIDDVPDRYRFPDLVQRRFVRLEELREALVVKLTPAPPPANYVVIVTVRNGEKWIARCLESIRRQTVDNWTCVVVDDVSTDRTADIAEEFCKDPRFSVQRNTERRYQAYNTVQAAREYAEDPEDVVMLIDGDDWLLNDRAFEVIRAAYMEGAWMTYGCLVESEGAPTRFGFYPRHIAKASRFREHVWCATPPRTFYRFLLDELKDDDFTIEGKWPAMAGDVCVYTPIMELAAERAVGIKEPIYVYNVETPDSEHKIDPYETTRIRDLLLQRTPKKRFER